MTGHLICSTRKKENSSQYTCLDLVTIDKYSKRNKQTTNRSCYQTTTLSFFLSLNKLIKKKMILYIWLLFKVITHMFYVRKRKTSF